MEVKDKKEYTRPQLMTLGQMKIITQGGFSTCQDNNTSKSCSTSSGGTRN